MSQQLIVDCDLVFERLTESPFPSQPARRQGAKQELQRDQLIQHHIDACHECRQLAESLRPALSLLTGAMTDVHLAHLPAYHGESNRPADSERSANRQRVDPWRRGPSGSNRNETRTNRWFAFGQALAVLLTCIGLAACFSLALAPSPSSISERSDDGDQLRPLRDGSPSADGLALLREFVVHQACWTTPMTVDHAFPLSIRHNDGSTQTDSSHATTDRASAASGHATKVQCCTGCHSAGSTTQLATTLSKQRLRQSCAVCHIWP